LGLTAMTSSNTGSVGQPPVSPQAGLARHRAVRLTLELLGPLLLATALLYAFAPALTQCYGYNDDYHLLLRKLHGTFSPINNECTLCGHPLSCLIWISSIPFPRSLEQLAGVRALGLIGTCLLGWLQFWHFRRRLGFSGPLSLGLSLAMLLTPAFAIFVGWAEHWNDPYACLASYGAGLLAWQAGSESATTWAQQHPIARELAIGVLLVLALTTYQPTAAYFFVPVMAGVITMRRPAGDSASMTKIVRRVGYCATVFIVWTFAYIITYKSLLAVLVPSQNVFAARAELVHDLGGKILYLGPVLWCTLTSWMRMQPAILQWAAAGFTIVGALATILLTSRKSYDKGLRPDWAIATTVLLALGAAVGPLLIVKENTVAFRTLPAAFAVWTLVALLGWREIAGWVFRSSRGRQFCEVVAVAGPVLFLIASTHHHLYRGLAKPNRKELQVLRQELHRRFTVTPERIVYIFPAPYVWNDPSMQSFAEFGARSSSMPWVTSAMFHLMFEGFRPTTNGAWPEIYVAPTAGAKASVVNGMALLDRMDLARPQSLPNIGDVRMLPNGWCSSSWLGSFDAAKYPWIWHPVLGWLYCEEKPSPDVWFYSLRFGWIRTSQEKWPVFWLVQAAQQARLSLRLPPDRPWRDAATGAELQVHLLNPLM
jgi:hypothetical protein